MERKTTSIKVDPELWKRVKKHCIDAEMDIGEWLEQVIKENLNQK